MSPKTVTARDIATAMRILSAYAEDPHNYRPMFFLGQVVCPPTAPMSPHNVNELKKCGFFQRDPREGLTPGPYVPELPWRAIG